jgi:hypothetical protein
MLSNGAFDDLPFKVEGNTVTLLGAVTRPTLKSDAEAVVKRVPGVEQADKNLVYIRANSVKGAFSVANELDVENNT